MNTKTTFFATTIAAVLVLSMALTPAFAAGIKDYKITDAGIDEGTLFVQVQGTAGGHVPDNGEDVYAYLFILDNGDIFAFTSHLPEDSDDVPIDLEWHAHLVTSAVSDNRGNPCITGELDMGVPTLDGDTMSIDDVDTPYDFTGRSVDTVLAVVADADEFGICVNKVWSSFSPEA